ncbi:TlpA family protein disulfide reductase [Virgibacillus byunsanensis]|uniref:TlpA family protein disulfide reductase n=1 Tax=Virgibacillus byunsanensis TaxID=570945 RepID=A0ABW3LJ23_9BACI
MKARLTLISLLFLLLVLTACTSSGSGSDSENENQLSIDAKDIKGKRVRLADDQPSLVYFMSASCPTCKDGEIMLNDVSRLYPEVQIITVDLDPYMDTVEGLAKFQKKFGGDWSHILDNEDRTITHEFGVKQLEETVLVDQNYKEVFRAVNPSLIEVQEALAKILVE